MKKTKLTINFLDVSQLNENQNYQKHSIQEGSIPDRVFREGMNIANNLMNHTSVRPLCLSEVTDGCWSGAGSPALHSVEVVTVYLLS